MIIKPIIPIWLMAIICIFFIIVIFLNIVLKSKKIEISNISSNIGNVFKSSIIDFAIKFLIITLLFIINLRPMIHNGESISINSDISVLFVIDTSVSMRALDYNGDKERFEGVINDCCNIVDELSGCKFSIITFGDTARRLIPFTADTNATKAELKSINIEKDLYAAGTSINSVKDVLETTLKKEYERKNENSKVVIFFISDGEITKKDEKLESLSNLKKYVINGAVMGYGTEAGGKMIENMYKDVRDSNGEPYYIKYYDQNNNRVVAISKIDEKNLKKIASDLGIDYVKMEKSSKINSKLKTIKIIAEESEENKEKIKTASDTYFYFAIPLVILLIVNFIIKKRKMI